jgi:GDP/UDP-N,N'-diacetylbacillosamine 2-epimerase (hydrolysing)
MSLLKSKKSILIITSSRSDFGLLRPLIKIIKKNNFFNYKLCITGSHLSKIYGYTYSEIKKDKFKVCYKIPILNLMRKKIDIVKAINEIIYKMINLFIKDNIKNIVLLGDRYEIFACAVAAYITKKKIIHFAGGEYTPFVYDNNFRDLISCMSDFHFVTMEQYKKNLIKKGICPQKIYTIGSLGVDNLKQLKLYKKSILSKKLNIFLDKKVILITFHPTTLLSLKTNLFELNSLLKALEERKDFILIFTGPGQDIMSNYFIKIIKKFCKNNKNAYFFLSLGSKIYLSLANLSEIIIGNSSSGISEIPSLKKITINVGNRQKGRLCGSSVINTRPFTKDILIAIKKAIFYNKKNNFLKKISNPYGAGDAAVKSHKILKNII